jgi:hemoglobin
MPQPETVTVASQAQADPPSQPETPFHRLGGHATMQAICDRFYDLMDSDPAYAELRAMHAPDLSRMRTSLASFLAGWSGGPRDWFEQNPGRCMMSVHKPYTISRTASVQWAEAMKRAIADVAPADGDLARAMAGVLEQLALGMGRD